MINIQIVNKEQKQYFDKQILGFIEKFANYNSNIEVWKQFGAGYCWHFAHLLQSTFGRGEVCLAAPFGHFVYGYDGAYYDIGGEYCGDAMYYIPERYLTKDIIDDFKHIPDVEYTPPTKEDCVKIMKRYCEDVGLKYDSSCEKYLK